MGDILLNGYNNYVKRGGKVFMHINSHIDSIIFAQDKLILKHEIPKIIEVN